MNGTHIASIMIGTIFGLTILGALLGLARKWKKALLRFGLIVVEFISALTMSGKISQYITVDMVVEWLGTDSLISELLLNVPSLYTVSLGLIRPILFVLCFIAFSIVSLLLYWIIALFLRYKPEEKTFPMAAMMIGALGTGIMPKSVFGLFERFSTFSAVVFNAILGVYLLKGIFPAQ